MSINELEQIERCLAARDRARAEQQVYERYSHISSIIIGFTAFVVLILFASIPLVMLAFWVMGD